MEEFPYLVHKLILTLTVLPYKPQWKWGKKMQSAGYNGAGTIVLLF